MLKACFILLTVILALCVFAGASHAANAVYTERKKRNAFKLKTALLLTGWLVYTGLLSQSGFLLDPSLPGRIPCFLFFPFLLFIFYFSFSKRSRPVVNAIPLHWLIYFQTFRVLIELLLFGLFMEYIMTWSATFEGYNFDIGIGMTAPFIAFLTMKKRLYRGAIRAWNIAGLFTLAIVLAIISTYAYHPSVFNQPTTILGKGFGMFPFTFMAGFFMPLALLMHVLALVKTSKKNYAG